MGFHFGKNRSNDLSWLNDREPVSFKKLQAVGSWVLLVTVSVFLAAVLCFSLGYRATAQDASMEPQILEGQQVLVNRLAYRLSSPERGDVVALYPGGDDTLNPLFLRVVAIPGETVEIMDGELLINGVPSGTSAGYDSMEDAGIAARQITLGNDEYFLLGDNRNDSLDSRDPYLGVVKENTIIGRVWLALPTGGGSLHRVRSSTRR
ncbi:MAG: signal peptidase I [Lachnospiraceae bacterium]